MQKEKDGINLRPESQDNLSAQPGKYSLVNTGIRDMKKVEKQEKIV